MSIARAFTTRHRKTDPVISAPYVERATSIRSGRPIIRTQISRPVELLSSTNNAAFYAPDIQGTTPIPRHASASTASTASSSSSVSGDGSESGVARGSITDASSVCDSPTEPAPNHLSIYFKPNVETRSSGSPAASRSASLTRAPSTAHAAAAAAPELPQRAPSHSKRAHERLSRKRSLVRMMSPPRQARDMVRSSPDLFSAAQFTSSALQHVVEAPRETAAASPFGNELAQLDEVAEEFGQVVRSAEADSDRAYLEARGLACLCADDYTREISAVLLDYLTDAPTNAAHDVAGWI